MIKNEQKEKDEKGLLKIIIEKLNLLILITSLQGKSKEEKIKILKNNADSFSKRELEKISGVDRHEF